MVSDNPEATYDTLDKYGRGLGGKRPEIRNWIRLSAVMKRSVMWYGSCPVRRRTTRCLIGEPGVGKTAVVEGLAQRIVSRGCTGRV